MSILFIDGFDSYAPVGNNVAKPDAGCDYTIVESNSLILDSANGRFGGGCAAMNGNGAYLKRILNGGAAFGELWAGFSSQATITQNSDTTLCTFDSQYGVEIEIRHNNSTGLFKVLRGGTLIGTSSTPIATDTLYHFYEMRAVFSATVGVIEVWCDNTQYLNLTAQNTKNNGSATGYTQFTLTNNNVAFSSRRYDDLYILDPSLGAQTTRLGDCRIQTLYPMSDAGPNVGTPSTAGAHYPMVNETGYNTTNYVDVDASSVGNEELFGMTDLSNANTVYAVRGISTVWKPDASSPNAQAIIKSGSTEFAGPTTALSPNTGARISALTVTDPATSAAWTVTGVNGAVAGLKTA